LSLKDLKPGQWAEVQGVDAEKSLRQHLLDMGLIPGAVIKIVKKAPLGDPIEILIHGYILTLRAAEAGGVAVKAIAAPTESAAAKEDDFGYNLSLHEHNAHPGYGEEGKYHHHEDEHPLPKGTTLTFALMGQQNCGKTTLFNRLTGSNQHVGNFPGVTVAAKSGPLLDNSGTLVTDLPGIYSLTPFTTEEQVARDAILREKPKAIINCVDANNIERSLYLTLQLMELGVPMVVALNMMDEVRGNGGSVRLNEMERQLGLPVVPIAAARGEGIDELVSHAIHVAKYQEVPVVQDFCDKDDNGGSCHRCLHGIMHLIEKKALAAGLSPRFAASRAVEGDEEVLGKLSLSDTEKDTIEGIITTMEAELGADRHTAMAQMRFSFIERVCSKTVIRPKANKKQRRSTLMDKVLTGKWTAVPSFAAVMGLVFWLTFDVIGAFLQDLIASGISSLGALVSVAFDRLQVSEVVRSLVLDAIFGGVGSVLSFVPIVLVLFLFLSVLEDSGYMARIAFLSDKLLSKIGLSGRSIVPMLIGFGCSVPGVMATRTLPSAHDRKLTILMMPFMSCSAKIAVYSFLVAAFFPGKGGMIMVGLYLLGIVLGVLMALVAKMLGKDKGASPFVMELPVYRLPSVKNVAHLLWDKVKDFLSMAFSVILVATIVIWFLQSFNFRLEFVQGEGSILALLAGAIAKIFAPVGLGDWRIVTALISGFLAKETIVSTLGVLGATGIFTTASAASMLVFCLIYSPCVAALSAIRRELGRRWTLWVVVFQCVLAWICAFITYLIVQ